MQKLALVIACGASGFNLGIILNSLVPADVLLCILIPALPGSIFIFRLIKIVLEDMQDNRRTKVNASESCVQNLEYCFQDQKENLAAIQAIFGND